MSPGSCTPKRTPRQWPCRMSFAVVATLASEVGCTASITTSHGVARRIAAHISRLCTITRVTLQNTAIVVACLSMAAAQVLSLHSHIGHSDDHDLFGLGVADSEVAHMADHLLHGDVDVDTPAVSGAKSSLPTAPLLLIGVLCALIVRTSSRLVYIAHPPFRPPKHRSLRYFLPPTQAPPRTS